MSEHREARFLEQKPVPSNLEEIQERVEELERRVAKLVDEVLAIQFEEALLLAARQQHWRRSIGHAVDLGLVQRRSAAAHHLSRLYGNPTAMLSLRTTEPRPAG